MGATPGWYEDPTRPGFERRWLGDDWADEWRPEGGATPPELSAPRSFNEVAAASRPPVGCAPLLGLGIVVLIVATVWYFAANPSHPEPPAAEPIPPAAEPIAPAEHLDVDPLASQAKSFCEELVLKQLKAPATAQFITEEPAGPEAGPWTIRGTVDAENGFSALLRNHFRCETSYDPATNMFSSTLAHLDTYAG